MFVLAGYIQQTIPVRVSTGKEHWYSSEVVEVSPNPVTAVAETDVKISTLVSVRDKVISAYEDIMKMAI